MTSRVEFSHVIDPADIDLTLCGILLPTYQRDEPTPWAMSSGDVAHWPEDDYPDGFAACSACDVRVWDL